MRKTRPKKTRFTSPASLAFLDIMSCGLGAVVLLFLVLKHSVAVNVDEVTRLSSDVSAATSRQIQLRDLSRTYDNLYQQANQKAAVWKEQINALSELLDRFHKGTKTASTELRKTEEEATTLPEPSDPDQLEVIGDGERQYLIGMEVKGKRIVLLADSSASMLAETIVAVIQWRNQNTSTQLRAPKWNRVQKTMRWLTARLPPDSEFAVYSFGEEINDHNGKSDWSNLRVAGELDRVISQFATVVPEGGSKLDDIFDEIARLNPRPDTVYIITDGLPTQFSKSTGKRNCFGKAVKDRTTVTPECRDQYFLRAAEDVRKRLPRTKINVILLPMEGDPRAGYLYWALTRASGGVMLAPAVDWP